MPTSGGTRKIFGGKLYPRKPTIGKQRPSLKKFNLVSSFKKFHHDLNLKILMINFILFFIKPKLWIVFLSLTNYFRRQVQSLQYKLRLSSSRDRFLKWKFKMSFEKVICLFWLFSVAKWRFSRRRDLAQNGSFGRKHVNIWKKSVSPQISQLRTAMLALLLGIPLSKRGIPLSKKIRK